MINNIYANAYTEVLIVLNNLVKDDYNKIPKEYINYLEDNCNKNYVFKYDKSKKFIEQNLLEETKYILFGIFEKFGATEKQKSIINKFKLDYEIKLDEKKKEKYNPDDLFKNEQKTTVVKNKNLPVEIKKENFFDKLINFIKGLFSKINKE